LQKEYKKLQKIGMVEIFDNIRKIYTFKSPCGELAEFIEFFSESSFEETERYMHGKTFSVKMFPSWTPTFYINLGSPYQISLGKTKYAIDKEKDVLILRDSIVERHNLPTDHIFTVKFFPGGLEAIFGISQATMAERVIDLKTVIPQAIIQQTKEFVSFDERFVFLQNYFLCLHQRRKKSTGHYFELVQDSIALFTSGHMQFNNAQLAEKMFVTSKTINRYFARTVGTTPKNYFSLLRTRAALQAYVSEADSFSVTDYGYYDMSHFYKDVVKFTGKRLNSQVG